jgi:SAM-dependent methyltransferase
MIKKFMISRLRRLQTRGSGKSCPICGWQGGKFLPHGLPVKRRFDAKCPQCGSLERHRLAWLTFQKLEMPEQFNTLHSAPEQSIEPLLRKRSAEYLSIDLMPGAMRQMDLTNLELADNSYYLVWCSNVLEHVPDDRKALSEIFRVCKPGGLAVLQVPVWTSKTIEDPSVKTPEDRLRVYYQRDHVRLYGDDFAERVSEAGFDVEIVRTRDFGPEAIFRHSLQYISTNEVFLARKPNQTVEL